MSSEETEAPPIKKRRRGRKRWWALGIFIALLVWLNGPGWRWIGGIGMRKALAAADMTADFELKGTLLGGIRIEGLSLSGGVIRKLEIGSVGPKYELSRLVRGKLDGVTINRIDAVIDLAAAPPKDPDEPEKPFDPQALGETLRKARKLVLPMELEAADLKFQLVRGEEQLVTLESSDFNHAPGSDDFSLKLGGLAVMGGYAFSAQETHIAWQEERLTLDRFDVTPRLGIRDLDVSFPTGAEPTARVELLAEDSRLIVDGGLSSAVVRLEGEPLVVGEALKNVALELPVEATVSRLEARIEGFDQSPDLLKANASAEVTNVSYEDWRAEAVVVDASKDGDKGEANWSIEALGGKLDGSAALVWRDLARQGWTDFEATLQASLPRLAPVFSALNEKFEFAPEDAPPLPETSLTLDATADSGPDGIRSAGGKVLLSPEKDAASLAAEATWTPDGKVAGTFGTTGMRAEFALDLEAKQYEAAATLESFRPENLAGWAAAAGVTLPEGMNATLTWQGGGDFAAQPHRGEFQVESFEWVRKETPPLLLKTTGSYAWPESLDLTQLVAKAEGQTITAEAHLADQVLKIPKIEWLDGETRLIGGQAEFPVPGEIRGANDFLRQTEPMNLFLESEWIDSDRIASWLPDAKNPLAAGSGRVNLVIAGTPAAPKIDLEVAVKGVQVADQPDVPITDATLNLDGADKSLVVEGEIKPSGYGTITLAGKMPYEPDKWAEDPDLLLGEQIEARVNVPPIDIATFKRFVPAAETLAGNLEAFFTATGTIGEPSLGGEIKLSGGAFEMTDSPAPPVKDANLLVKFADKDVVLESLSLESAGGTLKGSGKVGLEDTTKPTFDLSFTANALPLKRDDSMIVRADANLSIRGDLEVAAISGTVGIIDSIFYKDIEILPLRMPFTAPSRPSLPAIDPDEKSADLPEPFANWTLDVDIRTVDPLLIRGNLATGSAIANLHVGGTLGNIQPDGNAIVSEIEAKLPFSTLEVKNGVAKFTPGNGLNPELNIRGTSNIGRYDVNLFFYGPVNAPKTALTSDPPLPESEIMTLLATGTTSDGLEDGQAATLKAAQLILEEWRKGRLPFGDQVAKVLAVLNRVDIRIGEDDPLTGKRLNSATIEVTDRIFVSSSVDKESNTRVLGAFVLRFK
ncbi:translocation/assembly module TamB domain-containing protein [Luteolibacter marinus]|uniref:translocation/assembly module TamB domain-containing protein n=1 Tax=Luteolibacter marinus TaxID=2776705 RepID=UPI00186674AD|nr:translocation/assembly module TamB domain-containing protein [Luteolibacter marinus]